ncbi:hypothetical protein U1Q18_009192, partial [Sarracenia purpurea var. burkii]
MLRSLKSGDRLLLFHLARLRISVFARRTSSHLRRASQTASCAPSPAHGAPVLAFRRPLLPSVIPRCLPPLGLN